MMIKVRKQGTTPETKIIQNLRRGPIRRPPEGGGGGSVNLWHGWSDTLPTLERQSVEGWITVTMSKLLRSLGLRSELVLSGASPHKMQTK